MRSRFSAFAVGDEAYLHDSWDPVTRPRRIGIDTATRWTRLEVLGRTGGGLLDAHGTVEFRAHHDSGVVAENSRFRRVDGRWVYVGPV
jgi:SEC-C motif-containing protein